MEIFETPGNAQWRKLIYCSPMTDEILQSLYVNGLRRNFNIIININEGGKAL